MSDFNSVIQQNTLETQKRYHNRKVHIEKQMEEIPTCCTFLPSVLFD